MLIELLIGFINIAIIIPLRVNSKNDSKPGKCPAHVRHTDVRNTDPLFLLIKLLIGLLILLLAFLLELIVKMIASREMSGTRTFPPLNANRIIDRFINIAIIIPIRVNSKNDSKPGKCPAHVRHTDVRNTDPLHFPANKTINRFINLAISIPIRANSKNDSKPGNVRHTRTFPPLNANRIISRCMNIAIIIPLRVNSKNDSKPGKCPAHGCPEHGPSSFYC